MLCAWADMTLLTFLVAYAAQPGHHDPIFAVSCEFIDNALRATRDLTGSKRISVTFNLQSQSTLNEVGQSTLHDSQVHLILLCWHVRVDGRITAFLMICRTLLPSLTMDMACHLRACRTGPGLALFPRKS